MAQQSGRNLFDNEIAQSQNDALPELIKMDVFGASMTRASMEFPAQNDVLKIVKLGKPVKMQSIHWRNNDVLKSLQIKFNNGIETQVF